ncbi:hypothetical protein NLM31_36725 [Bradyrhizobium sp. CCGUVB4N]|uniref:hypothetical protein n=1 Tax=Bradyrhizobium sp. CCGUVB4N TaxID=2949631 RepID=UPI0020B44AF6|nr:hypothetical protein [Bradyrhizobium sp. CCGUVB4N]MCP3385947.1 hypothetical protein [Bradyrhizobium sp. CCGUVB4N]
MPDPGDPWELWKTLPRARQLALICETVGDRHDVPVARIRRGPPWHRSVSQARTYAIRMAYELLDPYTTADLTRDFRMDLVDAIRSKQKSSALPRAAELAALKDGIAVRLKAG